MFYIKILIFTKVMIMIQVTCINVGSTIFYNRNKCECWSQLELASLHARQVFDKIAFPLPSPESINDRYIKNVIHYYKRALKGCHGIYDEQTAKIFKESLSDVIGGHLQYEILPSTRFAYYAGYVTYRNVRNLHSFFDDIKKYLNTMGLGWRKAPSIPQWTNMTVAKIIIGTSLLVDSCSTLIIRRDANSCIHIPKPKLDDVQNPSAIAMPFKDHGFASLTSPLSENILLKYYTTGSKCILRNSPSKCRHSDFLAFNNNLWHWMKREVAPHLVEDKLYAAYAGILRIAAAVQNYGKGLSRRNLFETEDTSNKLRRWHPWKAFTDNYVYVTGDWTPLVYICFVVVAALAICLLQICQNYVFRSSRGCQCSSRRESQRSSQCYNCGVKEIAYSSIDSNIPAILPSHPQSAVYISDRNRIRQTPSHDKTISLASFKAQKVYDLNENVEKMMTVIMSDNEEQGSVGPSPSPSLHGVASMTSDTLGSSRVSKTLTKRSISPPKLKTKMSQVKVIKLSKSKEGSLKIPIFSTSDSISRSETTCNREQVLSQSVTSGSSSCSTGSSTNSKTRSRRSRSSRDLAWARRVISKHSSSNYTVTGSTPTLSNR